MNYVDYLLDIAIRLYPHDGHGCEVSVFVGCYGWVMPDEVLSEDAIRVRFQPGAFWWDPQDPTRGVNARTMSRFRLNGNEISTEDNHGYWGREFKLVQRSDARQKGGP